MARVTFSVGFSRISQPVEASRYPFPFGRTASLRAWSRSGEVADLQLEARHDQEVGLVELQDERGLGLDEVGGSW